MIHGAYDFNNSTFINFNANTYKFYESNYFEKYSDNELINAFNREIMNYGWASARAEYLSLLHNEFDKRYFEYSKIGDTDGFSLANIIELINVKGNKVININKYGKKILNIYTYLRENGINSIYLLPPNNNNPLSNLINTLKVFLKMKKIEIINFDDKNIDKNIPLLTYLTQYGSPILDVNKEYPDISIVIPFSLHSHIIKDIQYFSLKKGIYINNNEI